MQGIIACRKLGAELVVTDLLQSGEQSYWLLPSRRWGTCRFSRTGLRHILLDTSYSFGGEHMPKNASWQHLESWGSCIAGHSHQEGTEERDEENEWMSWELWRDFYGELKYIVLVAASWLMSSVHNGWWQLLCSDWCWGGDIFRGGLVICWRMLPGDLPWPGQDLPEHSKLSSEKTLNLLLIPLDVTRFSKQRYFFLLWKSRLP